MLQQDQPDDYVIATGETHSVKELVEEAFSYVGLNWKKYIDKDPRYYRPAEVDLLVGDPNKARKFLGWQARTTFRDLVHLMVNADVRLLESGENVEREGSSRFEVRGSRSGYGNHPV